MEGKLKQRFFEPLVLLNALSHAQESGQAQGDRVLEDPSPFTDDLAGRDAPQIRRDVLCQLCRICDYRKGEYTTIAMALEDRPSGPVYWISLDSRCQEKVIPFLRGVLTDIHRTCNQKPTLAAQQRLQMELEERFTTFAANRLHKTRKLLRKQLKGAMVAIEQASLNENDLMCTSKTLSFICEDTDDKRFVRLARGARRADGEHCQLARAVYGLIRQSQKS